jgi:hypothetical protein
VSGARIALASYPRSGNTWVRFLLEAATGESCGSVHKDRIMPRGDEGIVIKTHQLNSASYDGAVHLVRNPFDVLESHYHWKRDIAGELDREWERHVDEGVPAWKAHTEHWLAARCLVLRVRYEDLHADPVEQLRTVLEFLGRPASEVRLREAVQAARLEDMRVLHPVYGERFFRRGQVGASYSAFTEAQRQVVQSELGPLLQRLGYSAAAAAR